MRPSRAARAAAVAAGACATLVGCGDGQPAHTPPSRPGAATTPAPQHRPAAVPRGELAFHVRRRTQLRSGPGGRQLGVAIRTRTRFGSPVYLSVIEHRPGWVHVRTSVARAPSGWLPADAGRLLRQPRKIVIDLSRRRLRLLLHGRVTATYRVAVGRPDAPTPVGTFAVTDRLTVQPGTDYGCCILALNAHQRKIPQGWGGGDRVAIHATPHVEAIGHAVTHGCVRATDRALRSLMARVRLGTPVLIRR